MPSSIGSDFVRDQMIDFKLFVLEKPRLAWLPGLLFFAFSFVMDPAALNTLSGSGVGIVGVAQAQTIQPLSANDVSWLFPPPQTKSDMSHLIAISDVTVPDPKDASRRVPVWSDAAFQDFLTLADSEQAQVAGSDRIGLPAEARSRDNWFVAGIRIDAGAPGLSKQITDVYGRRPQIRIILQPIARDANGNPQIDDVAAHLIFDFVKPETPASLAACPLHATPNDDAFQGVVNDIAALRTKLATGGFGTNVVTAGLDLGVHPGLANSSTAAAVSADMKAFLERHIPDARLDSMAIMGLPAGKGAPWIFLSMLISPQTGRFAAVRGPTLDGTQFSMMLKPFGPSPRVVPPPHTNNQAPITCSSAVFGPAALPIAARMGESTSQIIDGSDQSPAKVTEVTELIADPTRSHFFNTDCVSCHTETRMAVDALGSSSINGISPSVLPNGPYDVRNFGWSIDGSVQGSVARRTQRETLAVAAWINANMPPK
jgi:hypothetical protein